MSFSASDENRIEAIESAIQSLQQAVRNLMSKAQMRQLLLIKEETIQALTDRVVALETQVSILQVPH